MGWGRRFTRKFDTLLDKNPKTTIIIGLAVVGSLTGYGAGVGSAGQRLLWAAGGAVVYGLGASVWVWRSKSRIFAPHEPDSIEYRIDVAAASVAQARQTFVDVEAELTARKKALEQIAADTEKYQALAGLSKEQVQAVNDEIGQHFRRAGRVTWIQLVISVVLAGVLGVFAPDIVMWVRSWWGG